MLAVLGVIHSAVASGTPRKSAKTAVRIFCATMLSQLKTMKTWWQRQRLWAPVSITSIPSASMSILTPEMRRQYRGPAPHRDTWRGMADLERIHHAG
jgi:hypothetical protein